MYLLTPRHEVSKKNDICRAYCPAYIVFLEFSSPRLKAWDVKYPIWKLVLYLRQPLLQFFRQEWLIEAVVQLPAFLMRDLLAR